MIVRQNAGRRHVELNYAQFRVFLDALDEFVSERYCIRLTID